MRKVRRAETAPELAVRATISKCRYVFELNRHDLPGTPDLVLTRHFVAIFVHGCFWHSHGCKKSRVPSTNSTFWKRKLEANMARDRRKAAALRRLGYSVVTVWECTIPKDRVGSGLRRRLARVRARIGRRRSKRGSRP
jgi:DNA mismatch endonuclease (patch repair protein)